MRRIPGGWKQPVTGNSFQFLLGPSLLMHDMVISCFSRFVSLEKATRQAGGAPKPTLIPLSDVTWVGGG